MGINKEFILTLLELRDRGIILGGSRVMELGAQEISAGPEAVGRLLEQAGFPGGPVATSAELFKRLGFEAYQAIDATGDRGALTLDLNRDLSKAYGFTETFDLVTNLGTLEHCFDQAACFRNMHNLCRSGGLMIHCLPAQGLVNHGFYNYHPRFVADLAAANGYEIINLFFTADFTPERIPYTIKNFRARDARDLMLYAVLRRTLDEDFKTPFDGMFASYNKLGYSSRTEPSEVLAGEFQPYIKTTWSNILEG